MNPEHGHGHGTIIVRTEIVFNIFSILKRYIMKNEERENKKKYVCEFDTVPGHYKLGKLCIITAIKPSQQGTEDACDLSQRWERRDEEWRVREIQPKICKYHIVHANMPRMITIIQCSFYSFICQNKTI